MKLSLFDVSSTRITQEIKPNKDGRIYVIAFCVNKSYNYDISI